MDLISMMIKFVSGSLGETTIYQAVKLLYEHKYEVSKSDRNAYASPHAFLKLWAKPYQMQYQVSGCVSSIWVMNGHLQHKY